jgi:hypothetical protein
VTFTQQYSLSSLKIPIIGEWLYFLVAKAAKLVPGSFAHPKIL